MYIIALQKCLGLAWKLATQIDMFHGLPEFLPTILKVL
jgi:hypothetical protein